MKCPHCRVDFHDDPVFVPFNKDKDGYWGTRSRVCPNCNRSVIELLCVYDVDQPGDKKKWTYSTPIYHQSLVYPKSPSRAPLSPDVPAKFADDYREACVVMSDSAKASAALSRRCLQLVLREVAKVKPSDLAHEIQEILDKGSLPSHLSESLDAIRNIGNFAAHPIKSKSTGEIVPVEIGEAEWNLDILEALFDYYFIQPAIIARKRDALNAKLKDAGKPDAKK
ncbi:hypothetical protein OpiT1DRAFT_00785 [Opitutaceae bacterium TAV1]|nr:hypothetical protein OpiT1DRAFT_00785 [Opitutaceae bacterium TAV1]